MTDAGAAVTPDSETLQANWRDWVSTHLGSHDSERTERAATAAREAITSGKGLDAAYAAARAAYGPVEVSDPNLTDMPGFLLSERLAAWQAAGIIDAPLAARIAAFEAARPPAERAPGRISVSEVIAYIGAIVLLVGVSFLYGTEYGNLGTVGRLVLIGIVAAVGFAAAELVGRRGSAGATRRARAAGWSVAAIATTAWLAQAFIDNNILTQRPQYDYPGATADTSGSIMLAAAIGAVLAGVLLWRAGSGLIAFVAASLTYASAGSLLAYLRPNEVSWAGEAVFLVAGGALAILAETVTHAYDRRWAREVLRFMAVLSPVIAALVFSTQPDNSTLETFAGVLAVGGFGLALARGSAGYAIASGIGLFLFVNEVGFRHYSDVLGFPVVLIISGIALFAIAGGLVGVLRRLRPRP